MAGVCEERLLKKDYYENCPGCKVELLKESQRGFPIREIVSVWIVVLCTALPISSLFPFIYFMIRDFHIAKREEDIGYYAGYVGASFMLGRALTSVFWGIVADRYGRKPVIIMGTITVVIFNTLFGLSVNFWMAICTRFLLGSLNGLLGPIRAYASEVFHEEYQALGLSTVSTAWGIGLIIGPALEVSLPRTSRPRRRLVQGMRRMASISWIPVLFYLTVFLPYIQLSIPSIGIFV